MTADRVVLNADEDSFHASVEQRNKPRLPRPSRDRGPAFVLAASYNAKARGAHTSMPCARALLLCPMR
jgi:DNA polymerase IV